MNKKMKNLFWLMLSFLLLSSASINAQVIIGSLDDPHPAAALEIRNDNPRGFMQGILFPRVPLMAASEWYPLDSSAEPVEGMVVYNTNASNAYDLKGKGLYIWIDNVWQKISLGDDLNPTEPIVLVTGITVSPSATQIPVGGSYVLHVAVTPSNATNKDVIWISSNPSVATVEDGIVTAQMVGNATITAISSENGNISSSCQVTVVTNQVSVSSIYLDHTSIGLKKGSSQQLIATVLPISATIKSVEWSSSNPAVATVSQDGTVVAVGKGTAVITATSVANREIFATCTVTVTANPFDLDSATPERGTVFTADGVQWVVLTRDAQGNVLIISRNNIATAIYANAHFGIGSDYFISACVARKTAENFYANNLSSLKSYAKKALINIESSWTVANQSGPCTQGLSAVSEYSSSPAAGMCFIPSAHEVNTYLSKSDPLMAQFRGGKYWLRSPTSSSCPLNAVSVNRSGNVVHENTAACNSDGVRVCMWINLQ